MKTLKESILDQGWNYDTFDPKTPFENALVNYFNTIEKIWWDSRGRDGRGRLYINSSDRLPDHIYDFAKKYLKKISKASAIRKNKCALRIAVDTKDQAMRLSFDNNPDNEYIDISTICIQLPYSRPSLLSARGQHVGCFAIEPHTFELLKLLIDNLIDNK